MIKLELTPREFQFLREMLDAGIQATTTGLSVKFEKAVAAHNATLEKKQKDKTDG